MSLTHVITRSYQDRSLTPITAIENVTADSEENYEEAIADSTSDHEVDWTATRSKLRSLVISSDQTVTFDINDVHSGTPQETITIQANTSLVWSLATDTVSRCPFSGDVTKFYVTNASGHTANVKVRALSAI